MRINFCRLDATKAHGTELNMSIFNKNFHPPLSITNASISIFPTSLEHAESDYKAVMENEDLLHIWSQSEWPSKEFTVEENLADVQIHVKDILDLRANGYMVYSPDK